VNFRLAITYLQFPIHVCFSAISACAMTVFPISLLLVSQKEHSSACDCQLRPMIVEVDLHCFRKNVTTLSRYNSETHESILIIFGTNVTEKVSNFIFLSHLTFASALPAGSRHRSL